jgi:SecD/SecF fusion protein
LQISYAKVCLGKPTTVKDVQRKDIDAVESALKEIETMLQMSGGVVTDASDSFDQLGKTQVSMQNEWSGREVLGRTGRAYTQKK